MPNVDDEVIVTTSSIQRPDGAAWKGVKGKIVGKTGDGYKVRFPDDFIAENVKENEITSA